MFLYRISTYGCALHDEIVSARQGYPRFYAKPGSALYMQYQCNHALQCSLLFLFLREIAKSPTSKTGHARCLPRSRSSESGFMVFARGRDFFSKGAGIRLTMPEYVDRQGRDNIAPPWHNTAIVIAWDVAPTRASVDARWILWIIYHPITSVIGVPAKRLSSAKVVYRRVRARAHTDRSLRGAKSESRDWFVTTKGEIPMETMARHENLLPFCIPSNSLEQKYKENCRMKHIILE